jgi:hypothetical protein
MYTFETYDPITRVYYPSGARFSTLAAAHDYVDRHYPWRTTRIVVVR